jgi:peroxiredoxin
MAAADSRTNRACAAFLGCLAVLLAAFTPAGRGAENGLNLRLLQAGPGDSIVMGEGGKTVAKPERNPSTLRWNNGESLTGEPLAASATELTWQSPLFADPLVLQWSALRRIDRALEPATASEPFSIALRDGSRVFGDIVAVTADTIAMRGERHGDAVLKRAEILSARRLKGGGIVVAGPAGEGQWRVWADTTKNIGALGTPVPLMRTGPGGALQLPYWNRGAVLDTAIPERAEIEFRVRSEQRPDFTLAIGAGGKHRVSIETWDEDLVLVAAKSFRTLRQLTDDERTVALRLFWDRPAQKCRVTTPSGEPIAEWDVPPDASNANQQVVLLNKGRELSLELLRVRHWNGGAPTKIVGGQPRVEFADGRILEGEIGAGAPGFLTMKAAGDDAATTHPLSEVEALVFSSEPPESRDPEMTLTYADGTLLHGRLEAIRDGRAALHTDFAEGALGTQWSGLRQLLRHRRASGDESRERPLAEWDTLVLPSVTLHGRLASTGEAQPRWLPIGGVQAVRPRAAAEAEFRRAVSPDAGPTDTPALFYLATGDVLPGTLRALDRTTVEIESSLTDVRRLATGALDAVQFGATSGSSLSGFGDDGWRVVRGDTKVEKTQDRAQLRAGGVLGHPAALHGSELKFTFTTDGFGALRLRLFCSALEAATGTSVIVAMMGNRLYWGLESTDGQIEDQQQMETRPDEAVTLRLVIGENDVELHLNGGLARRIQLPPAKRAGGGLLLEPASLWGNSVQRVTIAGFATTAGPGRAWLPDVNQEARLHALTVPRFRQDDPPRHALLAANGDVLRGEIEAITASHLGFRSGLENLRVPRDRVRAAIWLKPPDKDAPPPESPSLVTKTLETKLTRRVRYSSAGLSTLIGVLQREAPGLKVNLPPDVSGSARVSMQFGGQTVAEALEQICGYFALRYRVEGDTVILESGAPQAKDTVTKVYWLPFDAFPAAASARSVLASGGVSFSAKAAVLWEPRTGHLTVTDAPSAQEKIAAFLAARFGAPALSPTHWLLLTSGARLGLAVEAFGTDLVIGRHPIFGVCRVPITQIHTIRSSPPLPAPAMKTLADWRLVAAPEPVLPETGGQSSPTLGKEAKTFTLPLLGGGDFDLSAAQGKVVVLDFWATWCGPCIKSLPALLEAVAAFPAERVVFVGVNQSEPAEQVQRFLETRGWKFTVALDAGQKVARQYGVEGIPHTVIVGPDGKVAWVKTGYSPDGAAQTAEAIRQLLAAPGK